MANYLSDNDTAEDNDNEMPDQEEDWKELYYTTYSNCVKFNIAGNLTTDCQKHEVAEKEVVNTKKEIVMVKAEN